MVFGPRLTCLMKGTRPGLVVATAVRDRSLKAESPTRLWAATWNV